MRGGCLRRPPRTRIQTALIGRVPSACRTVSWVPQAETADIVGKVSGHGISGSVRQLAATKLCVLPRAIIFRPSPLASRILVDASALLDDPASSGDAIVTSTTPKVSAGSAQRLCKTGTIVRQISVLAAAVAAPTRSGTHYLWILWGKGHCRSNRWRCFTAWTLPYLRA